MVNPKIKLRNGLFKLHKLTPFERSIFIPVSNAVRSHPAIASMNRALLKNVKRRLISRAVADDCLRGVVYGTFVALSKNPKKIIEATNYMQPVEFKNFVSGLVSKALLAEYNHAIIKPEGLKGKTLLILIKDINRNPKVGVIIKKH